MHVVSWNEACVSSLYVQCRKATTDPNHMDGEFRKMMTGLSTSSSAQPQMRNLVAVVGIVAISGFIAGAT